MSEREKIRLLLDYIFGKGVAQALPLEQLTLSYSKRTGRLKSISLDSRLVATMRSDGSIAFTIFGAQLLSTSPSFAANCVVVNDEARDYVASGRSVFAKHILSCGSRIRPGADVAVLDSDRRVIAVGKAVLSARMMMSFKSGVAVKVRQGIGSHKN